MDEMRTLSRENAGLQATATEGAPDGTERRLDYDLHGLVGVRVLGATPIDGARVSAQLGPIAAPLSREPDIVIRFVDRLPISSPVRLLGLDDAGFTEDAFLILRSKQKSPARVSIPFDAVGGSCEITCERGLPAVPLLIAIVNLTALAKGALPMHAAAFRYRGTGVLVTGWSKGGKTETLLGFMVNGAEYIGDEWVHLSGDGRWMYGIPEPIRVWDWHLDELPLFRRRLGRGSRARLWTLRHLTKGLDRLSGHGRYQGSRWRRDVHRLSYLLKGQRHADLLPQKAFGQGFGPLAGPLEKVIFAASHDSPRIEVRRVEPEEIAARMAFSLQEERSDLVSYYRRFRFARPQQSNPFIDSADEVERERLRRVLEGKDCFGVFHPYPVSITALFDAVRPLLEA